MSIVSTDSHGGRFPEDVWRAPRGQITPSVSSERWRDFEDYAARSLTAYSDEAGQSVCEDMHNTMEDRKKSVINFFKSNLGVALVTSLIVFVMLVLIRPAFIVRKDSPTKISIERLCIWSLSVFVILGTWDYIIGFHRTIIVPVKESAASVWSGASP